MKLFGFLKKMEEKTSYKLGDSLIPKKCLSEIPVDISNEIDKINWADFHTAYGDATDTIPFYLKNLFCADKEIAMDATHQLWCSLCHQYAYISTAALPSYNILKIGLLQLDDDLKSQLLDIFNGFSNCTTNDYWGAFNQPPPNWEVELKDKLMSDLAMFTAFTTHTDEHISFFAGRIVEDLTSA